MDMQAWGTWEQNDEFGFANERERVDSQLAEIVNLLKQRAEGRMDAQEDRYKYLRRKILNSGVLTNDAREFLVKHGALQTLWDRTFKDIQGWAPRRQLVDNVFEATFIRREDGSASLVDFNNEVLHELNMGEAENLWRKAQDRLVRDDIDGALTVARTLLESVCKKIIASNGEAFGKDESPNSLAKRAAKMVIPEGVLGSDHLEEISRCVSRLVQQISDYRNKASDAHGTATAKEIEKHQIRYAVDIAGSTSIFLIECYRTHLSVSDLEKSL